MAPDSEKNDVNLEHFFHSSIKLYIVILIRFSIFIGGRSNGAMVLGKRAVPGRPTIWMIVGQGPNALA